MTFAPNRLQFGGMSIGVWVGALLCASAEDAPAPPDEAPVAGPARFALAAAGLGSFAVGTVWFFGGGQLLGAGDPAAVMMGAGFVGMAGAAIGGTTRALSQSESPFDGRVSDPLVSVGLGAGGTATFGESAPSGLNARVGPQLQLGNHLRLSPSAAVGTDLGRTVDVETRPQGGIDPVLAQRQQGLDVATELRWFPGDGADRVTGWNRIDLVAGTVAQVRWERYEYLQIGGERGIRRILFAPLTLGARWNLSERQRFEAVVGPRIDVVAWSDGAGGGFTAAPGYFGPLYFVTRYDIHVPHGDLLGAQARSRLRLGYTSSHFDGLGVDVGSVIGYAGALSVDWALEWRPYRAGGPGGWAWWTDLGVTLAEGGGAALTVGMVPRGRRP